MHFLHPPLLRVAIVVELSISCSIVYKTFTLLLSKGCNILHLLFIDDDDADHGEKIFMLGSLSCPA